MPYTALDLLRAEPERSFLYTRRFVEVFPTREALPFRPAGVSALPAIVFLASGLGEVIRELPLFVCGATPVRLGDLVAFVVVTVFDRVLPAECFDLLVRNLGISTVRLLAVKRDDVLARLLRWVMTLLFRLGTRGALPREITAGFLLKDLCGDLTVVALRGGEENRLLAPAPICVGGVEDRPAARKVVAPRF